MFKALFILAIALSPSLLAHPGHNHNATQASFIHTELIVAAITLIIGSAYLLVQKKRPSIFG